jgi:hypothetical protein
VKLLNDTLDSAVKIQSDSQGRQGKPGAESAPVRTELGLLHFRRSAESASA